MKDGEYEVREEDYIRYVDRTPFLIYLSLSMTSLLASVFLWPQLMIYTIIPVSMANFVGSPRQDRALLSIMNFLFAFLTSMYLRKNSVF